MKPYADTNFLVRLYLNLAQTDEAIDMMQRTKRDEGIVLPVGWLHRFEMINTLQFYVFLSRQGTGKRITSEVAQAAHASFQTDVREAGFLTPANLTISDLELQFEEIALRQTARHGFRTYDVLHIASALVLDCDTFWSFDSKALKLAKLEGLSVQELSA